MNDTFDEATELERDENPSSDRVTIPDLSTNNRLSGINFRERFMDVLGDGGARVESLKSPEIKDETIDEISAFYRETFNNEFPQFLACIPCRRQLPAWEVLGRAQKEIISLSEMNALERMPECEQCGGEMELYHDPQMTGKKLREKFRRDADLVMVRSSADDSIQALTFGYKRSLPEVFANEWEYEYAYTKDPAKGPKRNYGNFLARAAVAASLEYERLYGRPFKPDPERNVYCWNCVVVGPEMRKQGNLRGLLKTFFASIPPEARRDMPVLGEVMTGSDMHKFLRNLGGVEIPGVLGDDLMLMCSFLRFSSVQFTI
ncbi:hypothetical protein KJ951_03740 [Patescibacteria group bacterium]|nr:hypothetical protein [Patescibacteria group bacterium]MBU1703489.1 hypothetical protein [Patescibacteria group bacterium]MBU1953697.1 hypothetical protein [Patescibacteria group bacterium]